MNRRSLTAPVMVMLALACAPSPVWAQAPRAAGPFAGLFGGQTEATHTLDLRGLLFAATQKVVVPSGESLATPLDRRFQEDGAFGGASAALSYALDRRVEGTGFFVHGRSSVSDYSVSPKNPDLTFSADTGVSTKLRPRVEFATSAGTFYSPFFSFLTLPNAPGIDPAFGMPGFAFAMVPEPNVGFNGALGVTYSMTRRSSLGVQGVWRQTHFIEGDANDLLNYGASATFRHRFTRTLGFHAGYGQDRTRYPGSATLPTRGELIDTGLDYGDAVQLGRRTTFSFGSSTALVRNGDQTDFRLNGNAGIVRGIGRSWSISAGYVRSLQYMPGFTEPVLSDSAGGAFGGVFGRRVSWSSGATVSRGRVGFDATDPFTTYSATSGVSVAIVRTVGLYAQYGYYHYDLPAGSTTFEVLSNYSRQSVSAGLTLWVPIVNNGKADRDTR